MMLSMYVMLSGEVLFPVGSCQNQTGMNACSAVKKSQECVLQLSGYTPPWLFFAALYTFMPVLFQHALETARGMSLQA